MRAKFIYEKFSEDSDPVEDLDIGTRKQISKWMKERGDRDTDYVALVKCAKHGKTKWVKYLLAKGTNIDVHFVEDYALRYAADRGHIEIVKMLLDAGANVHQYDDQALRWATSSGHTEIVKILLDAGADVHAYNGDALESAVEHEHIEIVKILLDAGADVYAKDDRILLYAANNVVITKILQDHIAKENKAKKVKESLNEKFVEDSDPVEDLGIGTRKKISKFIEEYGVIDTDDHALAFCAERGKTEWVKFLLARGADVHYTEDYALRWAAEKGHTEIVKMLLDAGADVHAYNDYALRYAASNGHTEIVKILLDAGANEYKTALRWAIESGHTETVKVIRDYMAKEKKGLNEKFAEDSDPIEDLNISTIHKIQKMIRAELQYYIDVYIPDKFVQKIQDKEKVGFSVSYPGSKHYFELVYFLEYKTYELYMYNIDSGRLVKESDGIENLVVLIDIFEDWFMQDLDNIEQMH